MARILYLPVHSVLEADEVSLLQQIGHDVYSVSTILTGPTSLADRTKIDRSFHMKLAETFEETPQTLQAITDEFIDYFDIVISVHNYRWLIQNADRLRKKRCILRTIGQYLPEHEQELAGIDKRWFEIVRYSPFEANIRGYAGHDRIIRFYKDPEKFSGWKRNVDAILCFGNTLLRRPSHVSLSFMLRALAGFDLRLYGQGNAGLSAWRGQAEAGNMMDLYRSHAAYYSHHTIPACYTLSFIEALMTGIPVVAPGAGVLYSSDLGHAFRSYASYYEVPSIIENGKSGFVADTVEEAHRAFCILLNDVQRAAAIGAAGRKIAIGLFGKDVIAAWQELLADRV